MERSEAQHRGRGRGRGRGRINQSQSSSRYYQSNNRPPNAQPSSALNPTTTNYDEQALSTVVGTCPFMCPVDERARRERLRDLAVFERLDGNPGKTSSSLAVKKFCRTISSKHVQPSDVRPLRVLEDTLNYLFNLLDSREHPFEVVHEFIFDRTRSVRQDLSMQNIIGDQAVLMYEKMVFVSEFEASGSKEHKELVSKLTRHVSKAAVEPMLDNRWPRSQQFKDPCLSLEVHTFFRVKFHVLSHHRLRRCSGSPDISPMHHLNMEQLTKALASLYNLYEANRNPHSVYKNEAEFRSFYVLLHLASDSPPMGESLSLWFRRVPSPVIKSKEMCFSRKVLRYYRSGNYKRFICTTEAEASYLQYCIIEPCISEVRALAVSCLNYGGYKLHPYPLADLSKLLLMKESDVESFCRDCGLQTSMDEVGTKFLATKQTSFCHPKRGFQKYYLFDSERLERASVECSNFLCLQS